MGDVVLGELLRKRNLIPPAPPRTDYWVASEDGEQVIDVMRVAAELRRSGRSTEYALKPQQLSRQLKAATASGAESAILLKREGLPAGQVTVKDLATGGERSLPLEDLINSLK
jgi:histidyl-tRNA synthetase